MSDFFYIIVITIYYMFSMNTM